MSAILDAAPDRWSAIIGETTIDFATPEEKFEALAEAWSDEHPGSSIANFNSLAYQQIVGMGVVAIPFLLNRLRNGEGDWVYALMCISGEQAHTDAMNGDAERVIDAWLTWGEKRGGRSHGRIPG